MQFDHLKRRELITFLGAAAAAWPLAARAQQGKMATLGVLVTGNPGPEEFLRGFRNALREVGLIEGHNIRRRSGRPKPPVSRRRPQSWFASRSTSLLPP
jgi:hypothetical protein